MSEANKAVVRRFIEGYQTGHDDQVAREYLSDDFVNHSPFGPFSADKQGVLDLFTMFFAAFPDMQADIREQYSDGDKVITRKTFTGTHAGEFMGIPPTGNRIEYDVIDILTVRDGQMTEHRNVVDALTMLTQLGVVPPMG